MSRARWLLAAAFLLVSMQASLGRAGVTSPAPVLAEADSLPAASTGVPLVQDFKLVSAHQGWLLLHGGQQLFWTGDGGRSWRDITPSAAQAAPIQAVAFVDSAAGWLVLGQPGADGHMRFRLARTADAGRTWHVDDLSLFEAGDEAALAAGAHLYRLDADNAWLVVRRATSRNFSLGTLFRTADAGRSWTRLSVPIGDPVYFVTPQLGWVAGGAAGDELYRTQDGGQTWHAHDLPLAEGEARRVRLPAFDDGRRGLLAVDVQAGAQSRVEIYFSDDSGRSWALSELVPVAAEDFPGALLPLSAVEQRGWVLLEPGQAQLVRGDGDAPLALTQRNLAAGITRLEMATAQDGWALYASGQCARAGSAEARRLPAECATETRLLSTGDGGRTWQTLSLPGADLAADAGIATVEVTGQGFDSCTKPGLHQMLTWYAQSPYRVWNLYIGGSSRANCGTLTKSFVESLAGQGWKLIPTWVGPQAACTSFRTRMSYDPAIAFQQGIDEAKMAYATAAVLGLTPTSSTGAVIYYDLEAYPVGNQACRQAAAAFMDGWTQQLRLLGAKAGVYGAPCGSAMGDFANIPSVPDAVWLAAWLSPYQYRPDATVWLPEGSPGATCVSNDLWSDKQRLRQYSGGHNQTWGGVTINIDANVLDGVVATLPNPCPQGDGVTLYWHANYGCSNPTGDLGYRQRTVPGWQNVTDGHFNDQASSVRVPAGWSTRLFEHTNRAGASVCYHADVPFLAGNYPGTSTPINDSVSSFEVFNNSLCAYEWQVTYYADTELGSQCGTGTQPGVYLFRDTFGGWSPPGGCPPAGGAWSARFTRTKAWFDGGTYEFALFYDDGARLFVDNELVIDAWSGGPNYATRHVPAGDHVIRVEYRNHVGRGALQLWWRGPGAMPALEAQNANQWLVSYWGNHLQWGDPVARVNEGGGPVIRPWNAGGPGLEIPADYFSTRFERSIFFPCDTYSFTLQSDDGSRLAINGVSQPAFDHWQDGIWDTTATVELAPGVHKITIDHYEYAGLAKLNFHWAPVGQCPNAVYLPVIAR
jgi:photosystem II stability/assembly factor-like uncharacterized protein